MNKAQARPINDLTLAQGRKTRGPISMTAASSEQPQEWTPETLARFFHDTYEMLAPSFGYETREDTREFNPESKNGRLMVTVCGAVLLRFNAALTAAVEADRKSLNPILCKRIEKLEQELAAERATGQG